MSDAANHTVPSAADLAAYAEDAAPPPALAENILAQITRVAFEALEAQAAVTRAEEALKAAQGHLNDLEERILPELMDQARQDTLTTLPDAEGRRWEIKRGEVLRASIPKPNLPEAVMWLNANGQGSIVKRLISLPFGKGEDQKAAEAVSVLRDAGFHPDDAQSVHAQTLSAVLRDMLQEGKNIPMQLLGAHVMPFVKIKPAREERARARGRK